MRPVVVAKHTKNSYYVKPTKDAVVAKSGAGLTNKDGTMNGQWSSKRCRGIDRSSTLAVSFSLVAIALLFLGTSTASALSADTRLVDIDVGLGKDGVDVGVSAPDLGTDLDVGVGVGDEGVDVGVEAETPAGDVNVGVGNGSGGQQSDSSGGTNSTDSSPGSAEQEARPGSNGDSPSGSAAADREEGPGSNGGQLSGMDADANSGDASTTSGGSYGSIPESGTDTSGSSTGGTTGNNDSENSSVISRLVSVIPDWVWLLLAALAAGMIAACALALRERLKRRVADQVALLDALTGIANVKAFDERLEEEWSRARRYGGNLGLLLIDLDKFKQVNDEHGHSAGDEVLAETARQMTERTRTSDFCARIGGDEFAVICPETDLEGLKKLRDLLETDLPSEVGHGVGASIGIAAMRTSDEDSRVLVERADSSMYRRKAERRSDSISAFAVKSAA